MSQPLSFQPTRPKGLNRIGFTFVATLLAAGLASSPRALAQAVPFGAADDPAEQVRAAWWQDRNHLDVSGGLALIGPQWMGAASVEAQLAGRSYAARLRKTFHGGYYEYGEDYDELYDLARIVRFARYAPPNRQFYARLGPIQQLRLGTGHLVNFFSSTSSWADRTVGGELYLGTPIGNAAFFTSDVRPSAVAGGHVSGQPFGGARSPWLSTLKVGASGVADVGTLRDDEARDLVGYQVEAQAAPLQAGTIHLAPFASVAGYAEHGRGVMGGVDLRSENFIDLARFRLRLGLDASGDRFLPGYVGTFYPVSNPRARILNASRFQSPDSLHRFVDVPLRDVESSWGLTTELRLLFFEAFELSYSFRRHYGPQDLSTMHLRLFTRVSDRLTLDVRQSRGGLNGFFSPFSDLDDRTLLVFNAAYQVSGGLWARVRSRYSFEPRGTGGSGVKQYLVRRRFEPFVGIRYSF